MQAGYGKPARGFLLEQNLKKIIDFGDSQVFDEATTYPLILLAEKNNPEDNFRTVKINSSEFTDDFPQYVSDNSNIIEHKSLNDETWIISNAKEQILLKKILRDGKKLENYLDKPAVYGVKTGLTEAFIIDNKDRNKILKEDFVSGELIKPVLRGRDIQRWYSESDGVWMIATFPVKNIDIEKYIGIKNHLLRFGKDRLEQSGNKGSRKETPNKWFETQDTIAYWNEFEKTKIMYQRFQVKPCFILDNQKLFCNDSIWVLPTDDRVLLGILNSKMGWWLISKYCTAIRNGYQLIWKYFSQIPIAIGNDEIRDEIKNIVNSIIELKKQNPSADTSALESEIDRLVYRLYGLTEEEIEIVEKG